MAKKAFKKLMAANRAEIAVRIMRAATELNMETVAIYGYEDRKSQHRWGVPLLLRAVRQRKLWGACTSAARTPAATF